MSISLLYPALLLILLVLSSRPGRVLSRASQFVGLHLFIFNAQDRPRTTPCGFNVSISSKNRGQPQMNYTGHIKEMFLALPM